MPLTLTCQNCEKIFTFEQGHDDKPVCPRCGAVSSFKSVFEKEMESREKPMAISLEELARSKPTQVSSDKINIHKMSSIGVKTADDDSVIYRLGKYELVEEIARGGMGIVFKAAQEGLERFVALKVMKSGESASEEQIQRFLLEAQSVAKLTHPNIIPVYDIGQEGVYHYFTMEYVQGTTLDEIMSKKKFRMRDALRIIGKVAVALHYAHQHGIIHRDIKPSNIMIDKTDEPRIMDFGLARDINVDTHLTQTGVTMGTPNYMPPEQAMGKREQIDERSDVYALGAVLYEMLTGKEPFTGGNMMSVMKAVVEDDLVPLRKINQTISRDAETICMKAMEKEPARRYQTAEDMAKDIIRCLEGEAIMARPISIWEKAWRKARKYTAVTVTILISIILLSALSIYTAIRAEEDARQMQALGIFQGNGSDKGEKAFQDLKDKYEGDWENINNELDAIFVKIGNDDISDEEIVEQVLPMESWRTVSYILNRLKKGSQDERNAMFDVLVKMNNPISFYYMRRALLGKEPDFVIYMSNVLVAKEFNEAIIAVATLFDSEDSDVRGNAIKAVFNCTNRKSREIIADVLKGKNSELKIYILDLMNSPVDEYFSGILAELVNDGNAEVSAKAEALMNNENK